MEAPPLILTLALNTEAARFFNTLRQQHFPPERNYIVAHLTLFHQLPAHEPQLLQDIATLCEKQLTIKLKVIDVVSIGSGVAYKLESAVLQQIHKQLQQRWQRWLIPQDRQTLWPHITVQNKATPDTARMLLQQLRHSFSPFEVQGTGICLWKYLGGPWNLVQHFSFTDVY